MAPLSGRAASEDWDRLIREHDHTVILSLLGLGLKVDQAREIAQATWARLMEKHEGGELRELRLPGLAITQARFLALDEHRAARRRGLPIEDAADRASDTPGPEGSLLGRDRLRKALQALGACPPQAQRIFKLVYDDPGLSHAEVAAEVGLSLQRVRQILCEVRKRLREALEEQEA